MEKHEFYRDARRDSKGPLEGLRVVEATTTWAGPMCGCILADFGADVVKVEDLSGEVSRRSPPFLPDTTPPQSFMHATVNRNKRSLSLDLRKPAGREVLRDLVARADVFVENFRPGTLAGWGLGYRDLQKRNPRLVYASISGYGQFGPNHERVGYDPLAQASSGYQALNGSPDGPSVKSPTFLADDLAGLHAALAVLAALQHRDRHGEGQHIDVALLDSILFQSNGYLTLGAMGVDLPRMGNEFRIAAPASTYPCRDGEVMAGVLLDSHWKKLARLIGRPELADDEDFATTAARIARRDIVNELVAGWLRDKSRAEIVERFNEVGIPAEAVRSYDEAARDEHVLARDMLQTARDDGQTGLPLTGPAAKFSRTPTRVRSDAPSLGAHDEEILRELGYDAAGIRTLLESDVVGGSGEKPGG